MIIKSFIILSIVCNLVGLNGLASKFDGAVVRDMSGTKKIANAFSSNIKLPEILPRPLLKPDSKKLYVNARYYYLTDLESGVILEGLDYKTHVPIASTTKIMTAVVALENYDLDEIVTVSEKASTQVGADTYLRPGEKITVLNLLNCMLIKSGNDAAYALAEHMNNQGATGILTFVERMNKKAKELGMIDTFYMDPAGLDTNGYSTAFDLSEIARYAMKNTTFRQIVKKDTFVAQNIDNTIWHQLDNSNRLIGEYKYPGALGIKTGYMPGAGHCLVGAAQRDGHTLISVVLNTYADTPSASADESRRLLDWGFENYIWR